MANASDAKASVVLGSKKDSNPASSRFVASKLFAPGEKVEVSPVRTLRMALADSWQLKYGELLHAKSVIHPKHWHLSPCISLHIPTKFGLVWLHLNSLEGCGIYLHNANEPESRDSVEDGDVVYITSGARTNYKSPQLVGKLTEENLLEADYTWRHGEDQPSVPGRKFRFRKTGIYEGESALR